MTGSKVPQIRLRVLGPLSVEPAVSGARRLAVLVYLVLARPRGLHSRDRLIGLLWPEADQAAGRHALRNALHALRQALGSDLITTSGDALVGVDAQRIDCDALALESDIAAGRFDDAFSRHHGELLQGFFVPDAPEFEHWLDGEQRRFGDLIQRAAWSQAESLRTAGESERAAAAARHACGLAPDDELSLRRLLRFLDDIGDRAAALRAYDEFAERLAKDFDAHPSAETQALVSSLREPPTATAVNAAASRSRLPIAAPAPAPASEKAGARSETPNTVGASSHRRWTRRRSVFVSLSSLVILTAVSVSIVSQRHVAGAGSAQMPIAVMPFANELADTALAYVAPAIGGSIGDGLGNAVAIPYDATQQIEQSDPTSMRRRLEQRGARTVVKGTVRGTRDSLELSLTLSSVDGAVFDSARFRAPERELAVLRDSALASIRRATGAPNPPASGHLPDPEAWRLARSAEYQLSLRTLPALRDALDRYNRALAIDPEWPEPWLGRSRVYGSIAYRHGMEYRVGMRASEHDADEVLARNPNDARAYIERAMARFHLGDLVNARNDALLAEKLDTTDYHMQSLIGTWWQWTGDHLDSALFYTRRAERLAPWERQIALNVLEIVGCMPDSVEILRAADHVLDMDPTVPYALEVRAWTLARFGRWEEAADTYERRYRDYVRRGYTASARKLSGEARFRATVQALRRAAYADSGSVRPRDRLIEERVSLFEDLGWRDSSIAALQSVVDSLEMHRTNMMCGENLRAFRRDPRVQKIVKDRGWIPGEFGREWHR